MKKGKTAFCILALLILWPVFAAAQTPLGDPEKYIIELEGRYWPPKLDSTVRIVEDNIGTDVNLVDDLGFDERKGFGEVRVQIKIFDRNKFNFSYLPMKWDADQAVPREIQFEGRTYPPGSRVQSHLNLNLFKAGYELDFLTGRFGFLGATFDVLISDYDLELRAPALAIDEASRSTLPVPMVGLAGRISPVKRLSFSGKISGLPLGGYGHIFDAEASVEFNPIRFAGVSAGYRYLDAKVEWEENRADYRLEGPFLTLKMRF
jgi:hypothetical protein